MKKQKNKNGDTPAEESTPNDTDKAVESGAAKGTDEATLADERARLEDQLRRAMADLANIRKRQAKELDDARHRAVEGLSAELLPVLDNFHLALAAHDQQTGELSTEAKAMYDGILMVRSLLEGTLERHGLAEIPAAGETFDPTRHEAVGVDTETDASAGTITSVMQRGYTIGGKVLRASRVVVAGAPPEASDGEQEPAGDGDTGSAD